MWPVAIFLMLVVAFYWVAFYISVIAWLNAVGHLIRGNFIRSALWFNVGVFMLLWWYSKPHGWDDILPMAYVTVGLGVLATFLRWRKKQQAMQTIPTMPVWTPPADTTGNIAPIIELEYKRLPN